MINQNVQLRLPYVPARCPPIPSVANATANGTVTDINAEVIYTCKIGYQFPGGLQQKALKCLPSTKWNDTLPDCYSKCK